MVKKAGFDWGYKNAAALMGKAKGGPVKVAGYMRGGPVSIVGDKNRQTVTASKGNVTVQGSRQRGDKSVKATVRIPFAKGGAVKSKCK